MEKTLVKGKNLINEDITKIVSFKGLIFFFLKYSFHYTKILGSLLLILIIFFGTIAQIPFYFAFSAVENMSLFIISSMIYGSIFYVFRKSTIFENLRETNLNKTQIYFSIFVSMFLFTGLMYLFLLLLFSFFISTNSALLMENWPFKDLGIGENGIFLNSLNIQLLFWWYFSFILINFALFYFFSKYCWYKKKFLSFYLFLSYIINSFWKYWGSTNNNN